MHAAFILPNMGAGGTERVTLDLMAGFLARGARVDLVLMERSGEFLELVPDAVRIVELKTPRLRQAIGPLRRYFKAERPDAALAAMWPLTTAAIVAAAGLSPRPRIVVADHAPLLDQYADNAATIASLRLSIRLSYRFADGIVAASQGLADELARLSGVSQGRVTTIYNPIPAPARSDMARTPWPATSGKRILTAGRLKPVKRFDLVLEAFAPLARESDATLAILGEGSERSALEAQAARLGLQGRVLLPGYTSTPADWYRDADLFVLASDYEGLGNVLVEAMHCGASVVATDCPYGPREVLEGGRWGRLVPCGDAPALSAAMRAALAQPADREGQQARARQFGAGPAIEAYWRAMTS
jgi:glycosyltransferase involved in cell wall biosynthesis